MEPGKDLPSSLDQTNGLHSSQQQNNIRIIIGSKIFLSNKSILSSCSRYFRALLSSTSISESVSLLMKGIDAQTFADVLHMITIGDDKMTENNMLAIWRAVHHLKIDRLIPFCERFVTIYLTEENYLNIYQHAIALKSEIVHEKILLLMIRNFDRFIETDTFLNLTPKTLIEIITSGGIKSQDNVITAIFYWIYGIRIERLQICDASPKEENASGGNPKEENEPKESGESSKEENKPKESGESSKEENKPKESGESSNKENKPKERGGNADWFMEVSFNDRDLYSNTDDYPTNREALLGELISHVQFDLITTDVLRQLLEHDDLMENRDARNTVSRAISSQLKNGKLVKLQLIAEEITPESTSPSDLSFEDMCSELALSSPQLQQVILFIDRNLRLFAINILNNEIFHVAFEMNGACEDMFILDSKLYLVVNCSFLDPSYDLREYQIIDCKGETLLKQVYSGRKYRIKFVINGGFHYGFICVNRTSLKVLRAKRNDPFQIKWSDFEEYYEVGELTSLVNFGNEIVGFFSGEEEGKEVTSIFSFNTTSKCFNFILNLDGSAKNLATFTFKKRLIVIQGCGTLTELYRQDGFLQAESSPPLWDMPLEIFGALVLRNTFLVMARLDNVQDLPTTCQFGRIKFVNITNGANVCLYLPMPSHWLRKNLN